MKRIKFDSVVSVQPQKAVCDIILRLVPEIFDGKNNRAAVRYPVTMNATVVEIDENEKIASSTWSTLTSTISEHGLGLVSSRHVESELLIVELPVLHRPQYLVEVIWQKQVDQFHCLGTKIRDQL